MTSRSAPERVFPVLTSYMISGMWRWLACIGIIAGLATEPTRAQEAVAQFYKGKTDHGARRLLGRRRLRYLRAAPVAAYGQAYPWQSRDGGNEHGGRRQQRGGRASVQCRAAGRHGRLTRCSAIRSGSGTTRRNSCISDRRPSIIMSALLAPTRR